MAGKNYKIKITGQGYKVINKITDWYLKTADPHNICYCIKLEINLRSDLWLSQFDNIYISPGIICITTCLQSSDCKNTHDLNSNIYHVSITMTEVTFPGNVLHHRSEWYFKIKCICKKSIEHDIHIDIHKSPKLSKCPLTHHKISLIYILLQP